MNTAALQDVWVLFQVYPSIKYVESLQHTSFVKVVVYSCSRVLMKSAIYVQRGSIM